MLPTDPTFWADAPTVRVAPAIGWLYCGSADEFPPALRPAVNVPALVAVRAFDRFTLELRQDGGVEGDTLWSG